MNLETIMVVLEACQLPARYSEIKKFLGWYDWKLVRHIRLLVALGLLRRRNEAGDCVYEVSDAGLLVLKHLHQELEQPGMAVLVSTGGGHFD
ncbi:MAG: hypothetical protein QXZ06_06985 [Candidatus Jordarchaeales archaeon]